MKVKNGESPDVKREFVLTRTGDDTLYEVVRTISRSTGTTLTNSHFLRAVLKVLANCLPEIEKQAGRIRTLKRPSNAKANQAEREEFEDRLAFCIHSALRISKPKE